MPLLPSSWILVFLLGLGVLINVLAKDNKLKQLIGRSRLPKSILYHFGKFVGCHVNLEACLCIGSIPTRFTAHIVGSSWMKQPVSFDCFLVEVCTLFQLDYSSSETVYSVPVKFLSIREIFEQWVVGISTIEDFIYIDWTIRGDQAINNILSNLIFGFAESPICSVDGCGCLFLFLDFFFLGALVDGPAFLLVALVVGPAMVGDAAVIKDELLGQVACAAKLPAQLLLFALKTTMFSKCTHALACFCSPTTLTMRSMSVLWFSGEHVVIGSI